MILTIAENHREITLRCKLQNRVSNLHDNMRLAVVIKIVKYRLPKYSKWRKWDILYDVPHKENILGSQCIYGKYYFTFRKPFRCYCYYLYSSYLIYTLWHGRGQSRCHLTSKLSGIRQSRLNFSLLFYFLNYDKWMNICRVHRGR